MAGLTDAQHRRLLYGCRTLQLVSLVACAANVMAGMAFVVGVAFVEDWPLSPIWVAFVGFLLCGVAYVGAIIAERALLHRLRGRR